MWPDQHRARNEIVRAPTAVSEEDQKAGGTILRREDIQASLGPDVERSYVVKLRGGGELVGCWTENGAIEFMNDDDVLNYAHIEFLKRKGYPVFRSDAELEAHAWERGWSVRKRG